MTKISNQYNRVLVSKTFVYNQLFSVVEFPPKILEHDSEYRIRRGGDITLHVQYEAVPQPNDEWVVNSKIIKKTKHTKPSIDAKSANLTIKKVENTDAGIYKLRLENNCGEANVEVNLIVIGELLT